jgi:hypothetical protein
MSHSRLVLSILVTALLGTILAGCSTNDAPAKAAKEWFVAVNTLESLEADALVCDSMKDQFRNDMATGAVLNTLMSILLGGSLDIDLDISDVKFTTTQNQDNQAVVEASGAFRASVGGRVVSEPVAESWVMVREGGEWRWCGNLGSLAKKVTPQASVDVVEAMETPGLIGGTSAPIDVQPTPLPPEQLAAQAALSQVMNSKGIAPEAVVDVRYETIGKDESTAQILVTFDVWDDSHHTWLEDSRIAFQARFIAGKWNIDAANYEFEIGPGAEATIAVIEESTRVAVEQATASAAQTYNAQLGGTAVYIPSDVDYGPSYLDYLPLTFAVIDQFGNKSIINPVIPSEEGYGRPELSSYTLSPGGTELFVAVGYNRVFDGYRAVYSSNLTGEEVQLVAWWIWSSETPEEDSASIKQMVVSPDGKRIAMTGWWQDYDRDAVWTLDMSSGNRELLWVDDGDKRDIRVGPVAWSPESSSLFVLLSDTRCWGFSGRVACDGPASSLNQIVLDGSQDISEIRDLSQLDNSFWVYDSLVITPDGRDAILNIPYDSVTSGPRKGIVLFGLEDESLFFLREEEALCRLHLSSDGQRLVYTQWERLYVLNMTSGELHQAMSLPDMRIGDCIHTDFTWADN